MKNAGIPLLVLVAACATIAPKPAPEATPAAAPVATSAPDLVDHEGDSPQTAVQVPADVPNEGIDFENNWLYDRYGRFRRLKYSLAHDDQRRYDVVTIELPDSSEHTVYFDITEMWLKWKPSK